MDNKIISVPPNLISSRNNELIHFGTPRHSGRYPWGSGERPYQSIQPYKDSKAPMIFDKTTGDLYIKKGTVLKRVTTDKKDKTFSNRKYFSIAEEDHSQWAYGLGMDYLKKNQKTYEQIYLTTKDIKIANAAGIGKAYVDKIIKDPTFVERTVYDSHRIEKTKSGMNIGVNYPNNLNTLSSLNISANSPAGREALYVIKKAGYDGLLDEFGRNTPGVNAQFPIIIIDPDKKVKRKKTRLNPYVNRSNK